MAAKKSYFDSKKIRKAMTYANFKNLGHAGAVIRKVAAASIKKTKGPAAPGSAPHTHTGKLKKAIIYAADAFRVIIGPSAEIVGPAGKAHELGGEFRGHIFKKRPFMVPALMKVKSQIPKIWKSSIKE